MIAAQEAHPDKRISLYFQDEMRVGQKGRLCHRWWTRGRRPPGRQDQRYGRAYPFAAARPDGEDAFALVLPEASAATMQLFLDSFAATLASDDHAVIVLDRAGWHGAKALVVPDKVTLVPLPPHAPEPNPMERVWLYLRERFLSLRLLADDEAIVEACCTAWNALADDVERLRSLCLHPWIRKVIG
jgi:transposase